MRIASWNVNSIRARQERIKPWLEKEQPDVLCLQETKVEDQGFPRAEYEALGYSCVIHGGPTYNGVALFSRTPLTDVTRGFGDGGDDSQPRLIAGTLGDLRIIDVYVPNGKVPGSESFAYKLTWLERLRAFLDRHHDPGKPLLLCGDFNVAPEARDVYDPVALEGTIHVTQEERSAVEHVRQWGLADAFRRHHEEAGLYSWWDYRQLGFPKNRGYRIDLMFVTSPLAERCSGCVIDRNERKGKGASDHAPVVATFDWP